jgi:hypothetical protein
MKCKKNVGNVMPGNAESAGNVVSNAQNVVVNEVVPRQI